MNTPFDAVTARIARSVYVILMKDANGNPTLLADPGLGKPWSSRNKRLADFHAKACDGEARTWQDAFDYLKKHAPDLEKVLVDRARNTALNSRLKP